MHFYGKISPGRISETCYSSGYVGLSTSLNCVCS